VTAGTGPRRAPAGQQPASQQPLPAASPAAPLSGPVKLGDLLAGRYLLLETHAGSSVATLWRAQDEVLARSVAVTCILTPNKAARDGAAPFLDAAARLGGINHPGVGRVYDAAIESRPGRGNDVAYVISEWIDGEPLDDHLERVGALAAPDASDVSRQVAEALTALHAGGLAHGRVHPRNVLVTPAGRVRLLHAAVSSTLHDLARNGSITVDVAATPSAVADDTRDLAAVLYALTTTRWPAAATPQPAGSLAPAPLENGQVLSPRQLRAAIPRALDHVVLRGLQPGRLPAFGPLRTPSAFADATDDAVLDLRTAQLEEETKEPKPPGRIRRALPWVLAAAFISAVGVVGWTVGLAVGDLPSAGDAQAIVSSPEPAAPGVAPRPAIKLTAPVVVKDFDPLGRGDRQENPDQIPNAFDNDANTAWSTEQYRSATFSGLKPGVGLLVDLTKVTDLHSVRVAFSAPGANLEVRTSDVAPTTADDMTLIAAYTKGEQNAARVLQSGTKARYVLFWITLLPKDGDKYRVGISELRLT
jgi:serine/threonine protein kinase